MYVLAILTVLLIVTLGLCWYWPSWSQSATKDLPWAQTALNSLGDEVVTATAKRDLQPEREELSDTINLAGTPKALTCGALFRGLRKPELHARVDLEDGTEMTEMKDMKPE
jgi:hypothetical protein